MRKGERGRRFPRPVYISEVYREAIGTAGMAGLAGRSRTGLNRGAGSHENPAAAGTRAAAEGFEDFRIGGHRGVPRAGESVGILEWLNRHLGAMQRVLHGWFNRCPPSPSRRS